MSAHKTRWSASDLAQFPDDGQRYQVIDGELFVTPAPRGIHQDALMELTLLLAPYAKRCGCHLRFAPTDVRFSGVSSVQPDLLVLPPMHDGRRAPEFDAVGRLLLAVEVLSPSTNRLDRIVKRRLYQAQQVPEYWVIDIDARAVERWLPTSVVPEVLTEALKWCPVVGQAALSVDLCAYFAEVCDR